MNQRHSFYLAIGIAALCVAVGANAQEDQFGFIPPGGRTILLELIGNGDGGTLSDIAGRDQSEADWEAWAKSRNSALGQDRLATFSGYAALNLPLGDSVLEAIVESSDATLLPPDGKDLAIANCQFCHSLFSGYLMIDRDEIGWKNTFKAPFHQQIQMTEIERDTFAKYSAINMPMKFEDVIPEMRF